MMATPQLFMMGDPPASARPTLLLKEEEDDYFLPDDDDESLQHGDAHYSVAAATADETLLCFQQQTSSMDSSTSSSRSMPLDIIAEQPPVVPNSDAAAAILEEFFFGGQSELLSLFRNGVSSSKQQQKSSDAENGSPRSTIIPGCSCSSLDTAHIFSATNNKPSVLLGERRQASMPAMSSLSSSSSSSSLIKLPKRPSLKRRNSSAMANLSACSSSSISISTTAAAENNSIHNIPSSLSNSKHNVSFADISVREYDVELSDHPSCSYGPPIQLGWDYEEKEPTTVEDYEVTRSPHRRQNVHDLVLSYNARRHRLKHCSKQRYDKRDIAAAEKEIDKIKRERMITEFFLPAMVIDETIEKVCGYVKQVFQGPQRATSATASCRRCKIHS